MASDLWNMASDLSWPQQLILKPHSAPPVNEVEDDTELFSGLGCYC